MQTAHSCDLNAAGARSRADEVIDYKQEDLAVSGLKPIIDSVFPLARAADAHRRMESNESVGKIILTP